MQMEMHHALPGRRPDIHPDVVAVGGILLIKQPTGIMDERQKGGLLGCGRLKERGHVPERNEEQVAGAHRVQVIPGERCEKFARMMSEGAGVAGVIQIFSNLFLNTEE